MPYVPPISTISINNSPPSPSTSIPTAPSIVNNESPETSKDLPSLQEDHSTPKPGSHLTSPLEQAMSTSIISSSANNSSDQSLSQSMEKISISPLEHCTTEKPESQTDYNDVPDLSTSQTPSASSTSISSMASSQDISDKDGEYTPASSSGSPIEGEEDGRDELTKYRENLYAYTRGLYLEAKLNNRRAEKRRNLGISTGGYDQFGVKPSGMEKMRAKKAMAQRLRD